jgi:hypothetical protein
LLQAHARDLLHELDASMYDAMQAFLAGVSALRPVFHNRACFWRLKVRCQTGPDIHTLPTQVFKCKHRALGKGAAALQGHFQGRTIVKKNLGSVNARERQPSRRNLELPPCASAHRN